MASIRSCNSRIELSILSPRPLVTQPRPPIINTATSVNLDVRLIQPSEGSRAAGKPTALASLPLEVDAAVLGPGRLVAARRVERTARHLRQPVALDAEALQV